VGFGRAWVVALGIGLLGCGASDWLDTPPSSAVATDREDPTFTLRHGEINALPDRGRIELVFLGDSITQRWESTGRYVWNQHYADRGAANFGINGDRTEHVLWRIENGNFDGVRPRLIVLQIGTNNTHDSSDEDVVRGVLAVVEALQTRLPDTRVLLLGLFPKHRFPDAKVRGRVRAINGALSLQAPRPGVVFVDLGDVFLETDGSLSRSVMPDGLHLSARGYSMWAEAMETSLSPLLEVE